MVRQAGVGIIPIYQWLELQHAALQPIRMMARTAQALFRAPLNPASYTAWGRSVVAGCEMFERATRRYGKPAWRIKSTRDHGEEIAVAPVTVWERPFRKLVHFERAIASPSPQPRPCLPLQVPWLRC